VGVLLLRLDESRLSGLLLFHDAPRRTRHVLRPRRFAPAAVISKLVLPPEQIVVFALLKKFRGTASGSAEDKREKEKRVIAEAT
jgi:hypothetical protein